MKKKVLHQATKIAIEISSNTAGKARNTSIDVMKLSSFISQTPVKCSLSPVKDLRRNRKGLNIR